MFLNKTPQSCCKLREKRVNYILFQTVNYQFEISRDYQLHVPWLTIFLKIQYISEMNDKDIRVPVSLCLTVQSPPQCALPGCDGSLHADRGRWSGSARGCSSGSRRFYSGCNPAPCSPGNDGRRWWPGWKTDSWKRISEGVVQTSVICDSRISCSFSLV